jgi:hypothetical protein
MIKMISYSVPPTLGLFGVSSRLGREWLASKTKLLLAVGLIYFDTFAPEAYLLEYAKDEYKLAIKMHDTFPNKAKPTEREHFAVSLWLHLCLLIYCAF